MDKEKYSFELRRVSNSTLEDHFTGTFQEALQRGDRLASRLGKMRLYAYNDYLQLWEAIGTFLGHMRYVSKVSGQRIIKSDYTGLIEAAQTNDAEEYNPNPDAKFDLFPTKEQREVVQKYIDQINALGEEIRKLKDGQQHPHWISVEDSKPKLKHSDDNIKYSDTVIVTNGKYCTSARWLYYTLGGWYDWYDDGDQEVKDVTHWMPMPAPPKKGGL